MFILNIYYKDEVYNFEKDSKATNFPINLGSDIFSIQLHKWFGFDGEHNYQKKENFDECIYLTKYTEDSLQKNKKAIEEMNAKQRELFLKHPKFIEYLKTNNIEDYQDNNLMWDILGQDEYIKIARIATQNLSKVFQETEYEAILNKNDI